MRSLKIEFLKQKVQSLAHTLSKYKKGAEIPGKKGVVGMFYFLFFYFSICSSKLEASQALS